MRWVYYTQGLKRCENDAVRQAFHQDVQALCDEVGVILLPWRMASCEGTQDIIQSKERD
jgi:hypothetical protein